MPVISVRVDKHTYEALVKLAEARGMSLYSLVKTLLKAQVSSEVSSEVSYRELERKLSELTSKVSYLEGKIQELLTNVANKTLASGTSKVTASTGNVVSDKGNPGVSTSGGYEWCKPRSSIKNLGGFIEHVEKLFGLEDWWEEDGKVCFRTRARPAKI